MNSIADSQVDRLSDLAREVRDSGSLGRSDIVVRLFDFLLEQSLAGRSPKEIEIAHAVFSKKAGYDVAQDASVRVHIHRLRKRLDELPSHRDGDRLTIPRGEYRLALQQPDRDPAEHPIDGAASDLPELSPEPLPAPTSRVGTKPRWLVLAVCLGLVGGVALGAVASRWYAQTTDRDTRGDTAFWQPLEQSDRPTLVVAGDHYLFGEAAKPSGLTRLIREPTINSREDLDAYLMEHPGNIGRYVDLNLHYLPVSAASAMRDVLPLVNNLTRPTSAKPVSVIPMSRLSDDTIKGSNIVYVGLLSGMGALRQPLFAASGLTASARYEELVDRATGNRYRPNSTALGDTKSPLRDYAYLASFPGPQGNRILVIAGTRDPAVMQAAEIAADKTQLDQITARAGKSRGFEALYEVRTLGALNMSSRLILARGLNVGNLWRSGGSADPFLSAPRAAR